MKSIEKQIYELIILNCPKEKIAGEIKPNSRFLEDLEYDSVALMSLLVDIEEEFGIEVDNIEGSLRAFIDVNCFVDFIKEYVKETSYEKSSIN